MMSGISVGLTRLIIHDILKKIFTEEGLLMEFINSNLGVSFVAVLLLVAAGFFFALQLLLGKDESQGGEE